LTIWPVTIKRWESTQFPCVQVACDMLLKSSWRRLQLCFRPHLNQRSAHKVMGPKVAEVPTLVISRFGSFETKCHFDVGLMEKHKVYYKGEGGGFPQVWAVVNLVSLSCSWLVLAPKVFQLCTNHLVFGFVQVRVSSWCLSLLLVPSHSSSMPLYPQSATSQKVCPNSLLFRCFQFKLTFESIKELGNASRTHWEKSCLVWFIFMFFDLQQQPTLLVFSFPWWMIQI